MCAGQGQPSIEQRDSTPALETTGINHNDTVCKLTQQKPFQSEGNGRLSAAPGALVALRYTENGHVSLPDAQKGKPKNRGTVFIYGTSNAQSRIDLFLDVFGQWTADGNGGNKLGRLLATQDYDDKICRQTNGGQISLQREAQYPHAPDPVYGTEVLCQNDIALPPDVHVGEDYTLYWIWVWDTEKGVDPNLPNGKTEIYTSCADIDIIAAPKPASKRRVKNRQASPSAGSPDLNNAAIPAYVSSLMASPAPAGATAAVSAPAPKSDATTPAAHVEATSSAPAAPAATPNSAAVVAYIQNAVSAGVAAGLAAQNSKAPVTVTMQSVVSTPAAQASVPVAAKAASPVPASPAATLAASQASPVPAPSAMPPKSLDINPPVLVSAPAPAAPKFSGTASPAAASPAVAPSGASQNGTATAKTQGCSAQKCKSKRQSKILKKSGGQRL